jgi:basic membrane protein A
MIKTKRLFAAGLAAALVLAACGGDDDDSGGDGDGDGERVGLAFDTGGRGDGTFNDAAGRGADRAETELGVSVVELEAATADDRQPNLETLTDDGIEVIVANGFAFGDAVASVAAANPDTHYAITDGFIPDAPANVTHLGFAEHEGSFLVGAAAALACDCDSLGFIGGQEIDLIKKFEAGYVAGAEYINPNVSVNVQYLGAAGDNAAWGSPDKAKEIANSWYAEGVEVIYSAAGGSGQGTIEAATESDKWAIGVDSDSYLTASEEQQPHILTSMLKRVDVAVFDVYQQFLGDTLAASSGASGGFFTYDLKADGVGYSESGGFLADYVEQLEDIKAEIIAGTITVPSTVG